MPLTLTNTMSGQTEAFGPADPNHVALYVCGPTVYNYAHVGNAPPAVVFDVLYRILKRRYPRFTYARNFTDIDDKINAAAIEQSQIKAAVLEAGATLGLLEADPESWFTGANDNEADVAEIERLVSERETARSSRDFAEADHLREILTKMGVQLDDTPSGTAWRRTA